MTSSRPTLYFDEDVSAKIAANLTNRGFDVQTTSDAGNLGATDEEQLRYAASKGRVFITHNLKDFVALHARFVAAGKTHAGMVLVIRRKNANSIVLRLLQWIQSATSKDMENQLRYL